MAQWIAYQTSNQGCGFESRRADRYIYAGPVRSASCTGVTDHACWVIGTGNETNQIQCYRRQREVHITGQVLEGTYDGFGGGDDSTMMMRMTSSARFGRRR